LEKITQASIDYIKANYTYDDGELFRHKDGRSIGHTTPTGYVLAGINNKTYLLHRVIYAMHHGVFNHDIDHIDRDKSNNRIENLRPVEHRGQNTINSPPRSDNTSGYKGVTWHITSNKWHSSVFCKGKRHYVGIFDDIHEAAKEYNCKAIELFGEFAYLNKIGETK